jgi:hypothetical protein
LSTHQTTVGNFSGISDKHSLQVPKPKMGRPKKQTPIHWDNLVAATWEKHHLNALYLEKVRAIEQKQKIPHNTKQQIMLQKGYACEHASKQKRRTPRLFKIL